MSFFWDNCSNLMNILLKLVVWNMAGLWLSHHIRNVIIPTDELHHFSEGVGLNHQPDIAEIGGNPEK